jgi:KaiC/GvpD/RAD55 family RecA-like ATPase
MEVSIYKDSTDTTGARADISHILTAIKEGRWKEKVSHLRTLPKDQYNEQKKSLPCVTFCGSFNRREAAGIDLHAGMVIIDLDHLDPATMKAYCESMPLIPSVRACFRSPSGHGLKILFKVDSPPEFHKHAWNHIKSILESNYGMNVDKSGSDISRLCFVSWDEYMYNNPDVEALHIDCTNAAEDGSDTLQDRPTKFSGKKASQSVNYIYQVCLKWTEAKFNFTSGQRNSFIHALGCNLNRCGVSQQDATFLCATNFRELPYKEIGQCINSAYKHNVSQFDTIDVYQVENDGTDMEYPEQIVHSEDGMDEDFMQKFVVMLQHDVPKRLNFNVMMAYGLSLNEISDKVYDEAYLIELMTRAGKAHKESYATGDQLSYDTIEDMLGKVIEGFAGVEGATTFVHEFDKALGGSLQRGNYYGLIGMEKSCKSLWAAYLAAENAKEGVATLYLNGEMSGMQFIDRLVSKEVGVELIAGLESKEIIGKTAKILIADMQAKLRSNLFVHNGSGFTKEMIASTKRGIEHKTGKKIGIIVVDGHSQMSDEKKDESRSAIHNSGILKELAKEEDVVILDILHTSGSCYSHLRNQFEFVRGARKVTANMDGHFSFSRCIDQGASTKEDIIYREDVIYIRYVDKRGSGEVVSKVLKVSRPMVMTATSDDPRMYEVKLED